MAELVTRAGDTPEAAERLRFQSVIAYGPEKIAGEDALRPPPEALPWKRYLLWVLLVLGVALMGILARSAAREMNSRQAPPSSE